MQPADAEASRAEPHRLIAEPRLHRRADGLPESIRLRHRCSRRKAGEMCELARPWAGRDEYGVAAEIAERHRFAAGWKVLREGPGLRIHAGERRARHEDAFERAGNAVRRDGRTFPGVGRERDRAKPGIPGRPELPVRDPASHDAREIQRLRAI